MKEKETAFSNARIAVIFFVFLAFVVTISFIFKFVTVLKNGQFNGSRSFTIGITNNEDVQAITLSPDLKSIAIFRLRGIKSEKIGQFLGMPVDGFIASDSLNLDQKISSVFLGAIINYNKVKTNLTFIDLLRITMFVKSIPQASVDVIAATDMEKSVLDKIINRLINDISIGEDNQTVQIINATAVTGLGSRLARLITNMGGNVIIVATENRVIKKSTISYNDKKSYTVERLHKVLGYDVIKASEGGVADITIIIGEDHSDPSAF